MFKELDCVLPASNVNALASGLPEPAPLQRIGMLLVWKDTKSFVEAFSIAEIPVELSTGACLRLPAAG